jgi:hypothetical protein
MRRVIFVDWRSDNVRPSENCITLKPFTDDIDDAELHSLVGFLEGVVKFNMPDTRTAISRYNKNPHADHFLEEKRLLEDARRELALAQAAQNGGSMGGAVAANARRWLTSKPATPIVTLDGK